ncbi:MAG: 5-formyltetrahydrofolate cyclo-ligase [Burkholderiales bacterium]
MDKSALRKTLVQERLNLPDRLARAERIQRVMRIWLVGRPDTVIGAYWPIKGEFDPLPALYRWQEDALLGMEAATLPVASTQLATQSLAMRSPRRIGLPVVDKQSKTMVFHAWYPGCPMEDDAYGIAKPKDTEVVQPTLLFVPCVGYGPGGYRLGYGGGFFDRMLAHLEPRPTTVGLSFAQGFVPDFESEPHDIALDAVLNEEGAAWPVG